MIRSFFASIFVLFFVGVSTISIFLLAFFSFFTTAELSEGDFLAPLYELGVTEFVDGLEQNDAVALPPEDIEALVRDIVTLDDVVVVVDSMLDQFQTVEVDENGRLSYSLSFDWLLDKSSILVERVSRHYYDNLPRCESVDESLFAIEALDEIECIPPSLAFEDFSASASFFFEREILSDAPDDFAFDIDLAHQFAGKTLIELLSTIIDAMLIVFVIFLLILLGIIGLLIFRPMKKVLTWQATAVFLAALNTFVCSFLLLSLPKITDFSELLLGPEASEIPNAMIFMELYGIIVSVIFSDIAIWSGIISFAFLLIVIRLRISSDPS